MRLLSNKTALNTHGWRPSSGSILKVLIFIAIPAFLFIPVFYHSLTTPFALVDDYFDWTWVEVIENPSRLAHWFYERFLGFEYIGSRYRPFFEIYNMLAWKLFGPTPWLHHLSRWILHFAAVAAFSAAFLSFSSAKQDRASQLIPLALLLYVWLFFPNSPASRLAPQEVHTVFFLGLCNWTMALIILEKDKGRGPLAIILVRGLFFVGFLGLSMSKETNIAVMSWILAFYLYHVLFLWKRASWDVIVGILLFLIFAHMFFKVYIVHQVQGYGYSTLELTLEGFILNSKATLRGLFQVYTSFFVISIGFVTLSVLLLLNLLAKASRRRFDAQFAFVIFLLGQAASMFLILGASWSASPRYWYVLIPILTTLMAFSCKYLLETGIGMPRAVRSSVIIVLAGFIVYFICANYYNFLGQTIVQHNLRHTESKLIAAIVDLHDQGHRIHILENSNEHVINLVRYFRQFSPRFHNREYGGILESEPNRGLQPYYTVALHRRPTTETMAEIPEECTTMVSVVGESQQQSASLAYHLASLLQMESPHFSKDEGTDRPPVLTWRWAAKVPPYFSKDAGVAKVEKYHWAIRKVSCAET